MNDFAKLSFSELCDKLCENKKTLIIYHVRSDADAVGSAFALKELLGMMGIFAFCACAEDVPERLRFLSEDSQGGVVIDDDMDLGHERVISVDSASPAQLGSLFERLRRDVDIMIDHHASGTVYASNYIDASAAATGEIIYLIGRELLRQEKIQEFSPRFLNCIYAAISSDTGGFRFANVTERTHLIAAQLVRMGADAADINHRLFHSKTQKQVIAEGEAIKSLSFHLGGRVASVCIPYETRQRLGLNEEHMETIIEIPRSVSGVEIAFSVRQTKELSVFRVSMRSSGDFDVSAVCRRFGGGGHIRASGCNVIADTPQQAIQKIVSAIEETI